MLLNLKIPSRAILLIGAYIFLQVNDLIAESTPHDNAPGFSQSSAPTGPEIQGEEVANLANSNNSQGKTYAAGHEKNGLPQVVVGFSDAKHTLTMFFSPSCGHCSQFFGGDYRKFYSKFIVTRQVQFKPRLIINFANGNVDDVLGRLMWARGAKQFIPIMMFFMSAQRAWFLPAQEKDPKVRASKLQDLMKHIPQGTVAMKDVLNVLEINVNAPLAEDFIKVLGLIYGLSHTEIDMALKDEKTGNSLLLTADDPLVRKIRAVPAFFLGTERMADDFKPLAYFESMQTHNQATATKPVN